MKMKTWHTAFLRLQPGDIIGYEDCGVLHPQFIASFFLSITSQLFLNDNYQNSPYDKPVTKIHLQIYKNRCRHL